MNDYQSLVHSTRLTLAETFDPRIRLPKDFKEVYDFHKKEFPQYPVTPLAPELDVAILSFNDLPTHRTFLLMLEKAISLRFNKKVKVLSGTGWENAKLVIAPDYGIWGDPLLSKNVREEGRPFLGNIPLFLLTDLGLYMREPKLKSSLWKALCQELQR